MFEFLRKRLGGKVERRNEREPAAAAPQPVVSKAAPAGVERPTRSFESFFEHLKKVNEFSPSLCVDVGAAKGTTPIYRAFPDAYHIVFEPLPDFHAVLAETMKPYRHEIHHCALMESDGDRTLKRHPDQFGSSMMHRQKGNDGYLVDVPVRTLDGVLGNRAIDGDVLIKTDCQGADLHVLQGGEKTLKVASVVIVEASLFRFWGAHHPDIYEIIQYMYDRNFVLYDLLDGLYRPSDGALGQLDLAFVKRDGAFRQSIRW